MSVAIYTGEHRGSWGRYYIAIPTKVKWYKFQLLPSEEQSVYLSSAHTECISGGTSRRWRVGALVAMVTFVVDGQGKFYGFSVTLS